MNNIHLYIFIFVPFQTFLTQALEDGVRVSLLIEYTCTAVNILTLDRQTNGADITILISILLSFFTIISSIKMLLDSSKRKDCIKRQADALNRRTTTAMLSKPCAWQVVSRKL